MHFDLISVHSLFKVKIRNMGSKTITVRELSLRLDEMAKTFQSDLSKFKEEVVNVVPTSITRKDTVDEDFICRFAKFEEKVNDDINKIKQQLNNISKSQQNMPDIDKYIEQNNNKKILIHGLEEVDDDIYDTVLSIFDEKMEITLDKKDIACCFRFGKKTVNKKRPVLIEFAHQWRRDQIFYDKKKLKGTNFLITELLSKSVHKWFKECYKKFKNNCWTSYGKLIVLINGKKIIITNEHQLKNICK